MNIAVLGCGPSGLLSAYAAELAGHSVRIYSRLKKSLMPGAVHLHDHIPGLTTGEPEYRITYSKIGNAEGYARKVYGSSDAPCSFRKFPEGERDSWSMRAMYDKLWATYGDNISDISINDDIAAAMIREYDLVISTIPAQTLCQNPFHGFSSAKVWFGDKLPSDMAESMPENFVLFNGHEAWDWYRASRIDGFDSIESTVHFPGAYSGIKPTTNDCCCFPEIARVGRFGRWEKGILVHHAFKQAQEAIKQRELAHVS